MTKRKIATMTRLAALALVSLALAGCVYGYVEPAPPYGYYGYYGYGYYRTAPYANSSGDYDWQGGNGDNPAGG